MKQEIAAQELSFKHAVIHILHFWRSMLVLGLTIGILLAGYQTLSGIATWSDSVKDYEEQVEKYKDDLNDYKKQKTQLELAIDEKMEAAEKQSEYLKNSILINMDANNKMQASAEILVKLDESLWTKYNNAGYDPTDSLIFLYSNAIMNETNWEKIADDNKIDSRYIKELVDVQLQLSNNIISIEVSHPQKAIAINILNEVLKSLSSQTTTMQSKVFNHSITVVKGEPQKILDTELKQLQLNANSQLSDYTNSAINAKNSLKNLEEPSSVSPPSPIKFAVKVIITAIIGFIIGVLIIAGIRAMIYYCSSKIFSEAEISESNSIRILGSTAALKKRRFLPCVDKFIDSFADTDADLTPEQKENILIYNVEGVLASAKRLLLIGSVSQDEMESLKELLTSKIAKLEITIEKDIQNNVNSYNSINANDVIIMVEKIGTSKYSDISKAKNFIEINNKQISGCILV